MCSTCTSGPSATAWCSTSTQCPSSRWVRSSLTSASATRGQKKTGNKVTVVTLKDVEKIKELADAIHARGGKVVGTCVVCNPWLLDKLEPYCDALTIQYTVSAVALNNALNAQVDVISGDFAPTGKLSLTMVSDPAVIAITEQK